MYLLTAVCTTSLVQDCIEQVPVCPCGAKRRGAKQRRGYVSLREKETPLGSAVSSACRIQMSSWAGDPRSRWRKHRAD